MDPYGQFCPVAKASEILCERWTPLILRELFSGSSRFNDIRRGVPTCSPTLLSKRLRFLERTGIVVRGEAGAYELTEQGRELFPIILSMGVWGQRWARSDYGPEDLDPGLLLWDVQRNLRPGALGDHTVTVRFDFVHESPRRRFFWVVCTPTDVDLCIRDPHREVDVVIEADLAALTRVWMGDATFRSALRTGQITLTGPSDLVRRIPTWFGQNPHFASVAPATGGRGSADGVRRR